MRTLAILLALVTPAAAELAQPRPHAVVEDAVVRLSDLFDGAGPRGQAVLGPAPAPGRRQVVEAAQLHAIALSNGIAWRPVGGAERVVIERPGRSLPLVEVTERLREALRLDDGTDVELPGFVPPIVPTGGQPRIAVEQAAMEAAGGRFTATLTILAEGMPTQRVALAGRVVQTVPVVVAARRLALGEVVGPGDVRVERIPASRLRPGAVQRPDQVLGQALRRPAAADQPILVADVAAPVAVERGATVTMLYEAPGLALSAQGRAMEAGPRGATVPVMNLSSRIGVEAQVVGPGRVRVAAGTAR
jgi:flagella basal body P-ring formation protein FlgA